MDGVYDSDGTRKATEQEAKGIYRYALRHFKNEVDARAISATIAFALGIFSLSYGVIRVDSSWVIGLVYIAIGIVLGVLTGINIRKIMLTGDCALVFTNGDYEVQDCKIKAIKIDIKVPTMCTVAIEDSKGNETNQTYKVPVKGCEVGDKALLVTARSVGVGGTWPMKSGFTQVFTGYMLSEEGANQRL